MLKRKRKPLREISKEQLKSNQGISLIEMLLCVILSCIVISAIGGFMVTSVRQYAFVDREINLQTEAQTVLNQITGMIREADNVALKDNGTGPYMIVYYGLADVTSSADSKKKIVWFCSSKNKMYLYETANSSEYSNALAEINSGVPSNGDLMGNYVDSFQLSAGSSGLTSNSVKVEIGFKSTFKKSEKTYHATDTIKLRNTVVAIK